MNVQMKRVSALGPVLLLIALASGCSSSSSPTEPSESPGATVVAVVGCSQTSNAWGGWLETGDNRVWAIFENYGGGDVAEWARTLPNGDYWGRLEANLAGNSAPTAVWWQICDLRRDNGSFGDVTAMLAELQRRFPGATVYVSPLADFERPETCGKQDIDNSRALANHAASAAGAAPGPELPLVLDAWIQPPAGDGGCHVGAAGRQAFGATLASFPW